MSLNQYYPAFPRIKYPIAWGVPIMWGATLRPLPQGAPAFTPNNNTLTNKYLRLWSKGTRVRQICTKMGVGTRSRNWSRILWLLVPQMLGCSVKGILMWVAIIVLWRGKMSIEGCSPRWWRRLTRTLWISIQPQSALSKSRISISQRILSLRKPRILRKTVEIRITLSIKIILLALILSYSGVSFLIPTELILDKVVWMNN